jgi:hypothetical protein
MPYTDAGLPFTSGAGSHTSFKAARRQVATPRARARRGSKTRAYLDLLYDRGPLTDHEAHAALRERFGGAHTGIQSIRAALMTAGLVGRGVEERRSPYGADCHTWALTLAGRAAVQAMRA